MPWQRRRCLEALNPWLELAATGRVPLDPAGSMDTLRDRIAVITGGASGIGAGIARALAARGAHLVLADLDEGGMAQLAAELSAGGTQVLCQRTDVGDRAQVMALADAAFARFGQVHVLCNNA